MMIAGVVLFLAGIGVVGWQLFETFSWLYKDAENLDELVGRYEQEQDQAPSLSMLWYLVPAVICAAAGGAMFKLGLIRHAIVRNEPSIPNADAGRGENPTLTHTSGQGAADSPGPANSQQKYCSACDRRYPPGAMFCVKCGRELDATPR